MKLCLNMSYQKDSRKNGVNEEKQFRWAAEFFAGPGGFLEMAAIESRWFSNLEDAKFDAFECAQRQVEQFPFSHGKILKLILEDKNGDLVEQLVNVQDVPRR